jgi:exonuclease SbcC
MKIKKISCGQFAGIRDCDLSFDDGINVVYGKNESGKSTLVNLISRTLFQNAKLHGTTDKDFKKLYFPSSRKDGAYVGDFIDGKISFEGKGGSYTLEKEWGSKNEKTVLTTPHGQIREAKKINEILREVLVYGEGVYSDMLFSSQLSADISLQRILGEIEDNPKKGVTTRQDITDAVSLAFAESDGISIDAIEKAINEKIKKTEGAHWNFEAGLPERRKAGAGPWKNELGEVLPAYYALEKAREELEELYRLESEADNKAKEYKEAEEAVRSAEENFDTFNKYSTRLSLLSTHKRDIERFEKEIKTTAEALKSWPVYVESLDKARFLQTEFKNRELLDKYEAAKKISDGIKAAESELSGLSRPSDGEIRQVMTAEDAVRKLENRLCGMNLSATINMLGENTVEITSLLTGETIDTSDNPVSITESVKIIIPEVMEMQLSPADVNLKEVEKKIAENKAVRGGILNKYKVESHGELEELAKRFDSLISKSESEEKLLKSVLGGMPFEELESAVNEKITAPVRSREEIDSDILALCKSNNVVDFISRREAYIDGYVKDYGSIDSLKTKSLELETELEKTKKKVAEAEDIPKEFLDIADPEAHLEKLRDESTFRQNLLKSALEDKVKALSALDNHRDSISDDPYAELEKTEREFEEKKSLLKHWKNISRVFYLQKKKLEDNPMRDMAER